MKKIRILIADDHSLLRFGLTALFNRQDDMTVVGEAGDGVAAEAMAKDLQPDVVIMDLMMPRADGADATKAIKEALPDTNILILTSYGTSDDMVQAISNGATGVCIKSDTTEEILSAVRAVAAGEESFPEDIRRILRRTPSPKALTIRQIEILKLAANGHTTEDIAKKLDISASAVLKHFSAIFAKLGVNSRTEAIASAIHRNLLKSKI